MFDTMNGSRLAVVALSGLFAGCATLNEYADTNCQQVTEATSIIFAYRDIGGMNEQCREEKKLNRTVQNLTTFATSKRGDGSVCTECAALAFSAALEEKDPAVKKKLEKEAWFQLEKLKQESSCTAGVERKNADGSVTQEYNCAPTFAKPSLTK